MTEETAFIRGELTFWKCGICRGWHEGEIHKCPIKQIFEEIGLVQNQPRADFERDLWKIKQSKLRK